MNVRAAEQDGTAALNRAEALFDDLSELCVGIDSGEVMYAVAMLIAHGIREHSTDKTIDTTMNKLREIVALELKIEPSKDTKIT